jgi:hypothetical protein
MELYPDLTTMAHLGAELQNLTQVIASTRYGQVRGARALNGTAVFLGA